LAVTAYWENGELTVEEYLSRKRGNASSDMIYLLSLFDSEKAKSPDEVFAKHGREFTKSNFEDAVRELMRLGFLIKDPNSGYYLSGPSRIRFGQYRGAAHARCGPAGIIDGTCRHVYGAA